MLQIFPTLQNGIEQNITFIFWQKFTLWEYVYIAMCIASVKQETRRQLETKHVLKWDVLPQEELCKKYLLGIRSAT